MGDALLSVVIMDESVLGNQIPVNNVIVQTHFLRAKENESKDVFRVMRMCLYHSIACTSAEGERV